MVPKVTFSSSTSKMALEAKGYCMEIMQIVMEGEHSGDVQYTTGVTAKAGETIVGIWQ